METKSSPISIPHQKSNLNDDILIETERVLSVCRERYSKVLDKVVIKTMREVDAETFAEAFSELQASNPLFEGNSTHEDRKHYGRYLWERAIELSPWNVIAIEKNSNKCVGILLAYPAQGKVKNSKYENQLSEVCARHWNATLDVENQVVQRWVKDSQQNDVSRLLRIAYGGIEPSYRGSVGLYQILAAITQDSACKAGFRNVWSFTFNPAFYKKIINKAVPFSSLSGIVLSLVTFSLDNLNTTLLEYYLLPATLRALGMASTPLYCIRTSNASLLTCVWTCGRDPMLAKM
eukprot:TRINITY_DN14161_c1_g1_i1.p1 TRINITY_DN14161_c1_g1~~TRINITY_DN14161_c1_g1_i1.p1  ORF type:complete len:291 (+),score=47.61 TRINITY_DN14161_c1_g1_i1:117-989(+)